MRKTTLYTQLLVLAFATFLYWTPRPSLSQYAASTAPQLTQSYIICSLVDDPHKTVYYSGVFPGIESSLHVYEKSFSTHLEMQAITVIGTAKCSGYHNERAAKAGLATLQENWQWIYKQAVNTNWSYIPLTRYGRPNL